MAPWGVAFFQKRPAATVGTTRGHAVGRHVGEQGKQRQIRQAEAEGDDAQDHHDDAGHAHFLLGIPLHTGINGRQGLAAICADGGLMVLQFYHVGDQVIGHETGQRDQRGVQGAQSGGQNEGAHQAQHKGAAGHRAQLQNAGFRVAHHVTLCNGTQHHDTEDGVDRQPDAGGRGSQRGLLDLTHIFCQADAHEVRGVDQHNNRTQNDVGDPIG